MKKGLVKIMSAAMAVLMLASSAPVKNISALDETQNNVTAEKVISQKKKPAKVKNLKKASVSKTSVTLSWSKVSGVTKYVVYKYSGSKKKYVNVGSTKSTKFTVKKLKSNTVYKFVVKAYNGAYSDKSSAVKVRTKLSNSDALKLYDKANIAYVKWIYTSGSDYTHDYGDRIFYNGMEYYRIYHSSVNSIASLKKHLHKYFTKNTKGNAYEETIESLIDQRYIDYNNKLYTTAGGVGSTFDELKSVKVLSQSTKSAKIRITITCNDMFSNSSFTKTLKLKLSDGKWKFSGEFYFMA